LTSLPQQLVPPLTNLTREWDFYKVELSLRAVLVARKNQKNNREVYHALRKYSFNAKLPLSKSVITNLNHITKRKHNQNPDKPQITNNKHQPLAIFAPLYLLLDINSYQPINAT
jgi:hypothetical protein